MYSVFTETGRTQPQNTKIRYFTQYIRGKGEEAIVHSPETEYICICKHMNNRFKRC